jgi:hypothetical protein
MIKNSLKKLSLYSHGLMVLTTIHHVYGAYLYNTPWRLHVAFVSIPVLIITALVTRYLVKKETFKNRFLFWLYWGIILIVSVLLIGTYEGIYNHFLKDVLFFAHVGRHSLLKLFPPPKYEMPNDFIFEFTGVLQALIAVVLWVHFIRLTKLVIKQRIIIKEH